MDPNATLAKIREMAVEILSDEDSATYREVELAEMIRHLDDWLSKGGFPPRGWFDAK